jgi:O-antigen biosynthesis protein WbqP
MIRFFDILFSFVGLILLSPILIILIGIGFLDTRSPFFRQERIGKNKIPFNLLKFRSMHVNTPSVPTHLANSSSVTRYGIFLRNSKLVEIPQLWNVLVGDMSLVGPRPNLFIQVALIEERNKRGVYTVRPGITGLSQIKKIDMSTPKLLAETDAKMIDHFNLWYYFKYILLTVFGKGFGDMVRKY